MTVTILGNNSALPAFGRHPSAQTVSVFGEIILIDCGEGTQIQMQRYGIKWRKLHHIFISHLHGDHYFGLPGLLNSMSLNGRTEPLYLHAPAPLKAIIDQIMAVADSTLSYPLHFQALPDGPATLFDSPYFTLTCFPVEHRIACHGCLITTKTRGRKLLPEKCRELNIPEAAYPSLKNGEDYILENGTTIANELVTTDGPAPKRYAYCADSVFTDSYLQYIRDADAIYHESTYLEDSAEKAQLRFHCTAAQAAQTAKAANTKLLLLGHFSSKYKDLDGFKTEAEAIFPNVEVTMEGITYEIG